MSSEPRCEVEFDSRTGRFAQVRCINWPDDRKAQQRLATERVEQITKQLECPHGFTNKERRQLYRERTVLQKAFLQTTEIPEAKKGGGSKEVESG